MSPWGAWVCALALAALLELDNASAGQFMICRPVVLGPALGLLLGHPAMGATFGVLFELFCLEELPVGGSLPFNATVAAAATLLLAASPTPSPPELAFPVGLLAGWAHAKAESFLRRGRGRLNARIAERLRAGKDPCLGGLAARELAAQVGATLALLFAAAAIGTSLNPWWSQSPAPLRSGLRFAMAVAPWLGLWSLTRSFKVVA